MPLYFTYILASRANTVKTVVEMSEKKLAVKYNLKALTDMLERVQKREDIALEIRLLRLKKQSQRLQQLIDSIGKTKI